jgi:hypothetical protein
MKFWQKFLVGLSGLAVAGTVVLGLQNLNNEVVGQNLSAYFTRGDANPTTMLWLLMVLQVVVYLVVLPSVLWGDKVLFGAGSFNYFNVRKSRALRDALTKNAGTVRTLSAIGMSGIALATLVLMYGLTTVSDANTLNVSGLALFIIGFGSLTFLDFKLLWMTEVNWKLDKK